MCVVMMCVSAKGASRKVKEITEKSLSFMLEWNGKETKIIADDIQMRPRFADGE